MHFLVRYDEMSVISASQPTVHSWLRHGHLKKSECFINTIFSDFLEDNCLADTYQAESTTFKGIGMFNHCMELVEIHKNT